MDVSKPHSSAVDHEHPSSIAERFVDGFMHPGLEHDAERLARGYQDLEEQLEATQKALRNLMDALTVDEDGELLGGPDSWGPAWVTAVELFASNPASIREEVRAIEGPLSPDELEGTVTRALDGFGGSSPASVFPAGGASVGEKNLRVGQPGHSRIMDRAIKDSNTNKGPSS